MKCCLFLLFAGLHSLCFQANAQEPAQSAPQTTEISPELGRLEGTDPENHVAYVRIFLRGALIPANETALLRPPTLTAQCTRQPSGKLAFELFANFSGADDHAYHRPWMPKDGGTFAPAAGKAMVTMEFLGYTRVKPVKRQWDRLDRPAGELRYSSPSMGSANMEDIGHYMRYLRALPTLRLTYDGSTAQFLTTPLIKRLDLEPLCHAGSL